MQFLIWAVQEHWIPCKQLGEKSNEGPDPISIELPKTLVACLSENVHFEHGDVVWDAMHANNCPEGMTNSTNKSMKPQTPKVQYSPIKGKLWSYFG